MKKFSFEDIDELENDSTFKLKELDLSFGNSGLTEIHRLVESPLIEDLEILNLAGLKLGDDIVKVLCQGFDFEKLKVLDLASTKISDEGVTFLTRNIDKFPRLSELNLRRNDIGAKGAKALFECSFPQKMEYINLGYNERMTKDETDLLQKKFRSVLF